MKLRRWVRPFLQDESGQTTAEYIFLLATVVALFLIFARAFRPILERFSAAVGDVVERRLSEGLYKVNVGK